MLRWLHFGHISTVTQDDEDYDQSMPFSPYIHTSRRSGQARG
jgi:hypothetical protein